MVSESAYWGTAIVSIFLTSNCLHMMILLGCGFAPPSLFHRMLNQSSQMKRGQKYDAVMVRVFCSSLGWGKGVLMKKPSITKIQLPSSMMKVQKSTLNTSDDFAYVLVKQVYPSKGCNAIGNELSGKNISKSAIDNIKELREQDQFINLLKMNGLCDDDIREYDDCFYDESNKMCKPRRDDKVSLSWSEGFKGRFYIKLTLFCLF